MASKHNLPGHLEHSATSQAEQLAATDIANYDTLSPLPFVTIDSANTLDMDDAIAVSMVGDDYKLSVAIADPSGEIAADSALGQAALERAQTVYLPGQSRHMLPSELSQHRYSLVEAEPRPALICHMLIGADGAIGEFNFELATVQSTRKLSYQGVSDWLGDNQQALKLSDAQSSSLTALHRLAQLRQAYRLEHALVMEDKPDYDLELNEQGKITTIHKRHKTQAHLMVEEAMLACNMCAAEFFIEHKLPALFSHHAGIKSDKLKAVQEVLQEDHPKLADLQLDSLAGYRTLMQCLSQDDPQLLLTCKRLLQASELQLEPGAHLGLGLSAYATITSPIRRYQDFYNHLLIKAVLQDSAIPTPPTAEQVTHLHGQISAGRQAVRQMEQWLHVQYMADKLGTEHRATVALVNGQGIGLRLDDSGIEGFALLQNKSAPWELDHRRLKLVRGDTVYQLGQSLTVKVESIDAANRRIAVSIVDTPSS